MFPLFPKCLLIFLKMIVPWLPVNNKHLSDLTSKSLLNLVILPPLSKNKDIRSCHCKNSPFIDPRHCQILTGDLRIVNLVIINV